MPLEKLKKFSKFAKNEVKAVKVAVLAAPCNVLVAPRGVSATPCGVPAALRGMFAIQDTHGNSRGAWGTLGGERGVLYMKNFYGLELLKNHF